MTLAEMEQAVSAAKAELRRADLMADQLASLLKGRLRKVNGWGVLADLKRELKGYNIHTGRWSDK